MNCRQLFVSVFVTIELYLKIAELNILFRFCANPIRYGRGKPCPFPKGKGYKKEGK